MKNGYDSERNIALRPKTQEILADYIDHNRNDVTDEHGRRPLFVMSNGKTRGHHNGLRHTVYAWTRPCAIGHDCPHDTNPDACDATRRKNWASRCESSESTHAIRRGAISWYLREEAGKAIVSERADVQPDVLDKHYNTLTQSEKAEVRRGELPDEL